MKKTAFFALPLFFIGILLTLLIAAGTAWGDMEATYYGFDNLGDHTLTTLQCPVFMTRGETNMVSATFRNSSDRHQQFIVRADISAPGLLDSTQQFVALDAGKSEKVEWGVSPDNIDLEYFILVKVFQYAAYQMPLRQATCGILILPASPLTGTQILIIFLAIGLSSIAGGWLLWARVDRAANKRSPSIQRASGILALVVLLALIVSLLGNWMFGILLIFLSIFLMLGLGFYVLMR